MPSWSPMSWLTTIFKPVPPPSPKPTPTMEPKIVKFPLKPEQYYQGVYIKKYIFLHHTAGNTAASSIAHWASNPDHIATPYIIDRDGTIYETFDPKYWAFHLGVKGNVEIEKASIGIEICSYGALKEAGNGVFLTYTDKVLPIECVTKIDPAFRPGPVYKGKYWEAYTPKQIAALKLLLPYLQKKFGIKMQADRKDFWEYQNPSTLTSGVYSHTTVRKDKIDIFPQKELIDLVYSL